MPYTSTTESSPVTNKWYGNGGLLASSTNPYVPNHGKVQYNRGGTNHPTAVSLAKKRRSANSRFEWVPVLIRKGPKLLHKVWSHRLKKMVWARAVSEVRWKLKRVPSYSMPKPLKGLDLPPNALSYASSQTSYYAGSREGSLRYIGRPPYGAYYWDITGDLTARVFPSGPAFGPNVSSYTGGYGPNHPNTFAAITRCDEKSTGKLYEKAKRQSINLAQALAERSQTSKLILDLIKGLVSFWIKIKKADLFGAFGSILPKSPKEIANIHLMYRYGVMPLINDFKGAIDALKSPEDTYYKLHTSSKEELPRTVVYDVTQSINGVKARTVIYHWAEVKVVHKMRIRIRSNLDAFKSSMKSFGFSNPNALAYELIPFSFVVDWFIPIGDYLSKTDAFEGLTLDAATKTVLCKEFYQFERTFEEDVSNPYYKLVTPKTVGFVCERFSCNRTLLRSPPPLPNPDFSIDQKIIRKNVLTALALIVQLKKR